MSSWNGVEGFKIVNGLLLNLNLGLEFQVILASQHFFGQKLEGDWTLRRPSTLPRIFPEDGVSLQRHLGGPPGSDPISGWFGGSSCGPQRLREALLSMRSATMGPSSLTEDEMNLRDSFEHAQHEPAGPLMAPS